MSLVHADPTFASWGLCELLCHESRRAAPGDAGLSIHLGELAVTVADSLGEGGPAEDRWTYQLRAYACAHLGRGVTAGNPRLLSGSGDRSSFDRSPTGDLPAPRREPA